MEVFIATIGVWVKILFYPIRKTLGIVSVEERLNLLEKQLLLSCPECNGIGRMSVIRFEADGAGGQEPVLLCNYAKCGFQTKGGTLRNMLGGTRFEE